VKLDEIINDDDAPLLIRLLQQRLDKGEPVHYTSEVEDKWERISIRHYLLQSITRITSGDARTTLLFKTVDGKSLSASISDSLIHLYGLKKEDGGWRLVHEAN